MIKNLLSVIIPTYNRDAKLLKRSVESVLAQDYPHIEIFVVDDNADDNSISEGIVKYCSLFDNVHYAKQKGNKGACAARNLGIILSNGEYIGFLDDDDTWEPDKVAKQLRCFINNVGMVFCKGFLVHEIGDMQEKHYYINEKDFKKQIVFNDLLVKDYIGSTSQAIVHKKCFIKCGGFDELLLARQDYEMWIRISKYFDIIGVDEFLFTHYIHAGEQISKNSRNSLQGYERVYRLYKQDFRRNKIGRKNIIYSIISAARASKQYRIAIKYLFNNISVMFPIVYEFAVRKLWKKKPASL